MKLQTALSVIRSLETGTHTGRLVGILPTALQSNGPNVPVGTLCRIAGRREEQGMLAEVVAVHRDFVSLIPHGDINGLSLGARVVALSSQAQLPVGPGFLGRAIDALGQPIDHGGPISADGFAELNPDPPLPFERETRCEILQTGIRVIDGLLTLGAGQRVGVLAASGVGKTSLISQLLRQVKADVCIACLVGERGREVEAIWANDLAGDARQRSILVAATSDQPAALRVRAVHQAVALARYWRERGMNVFFVLDSVTRFAMALREIGLAAGEPPTVRAYTPNVFAVIPRLVEQFGSLRAGGSIAAVMTVLSETDDMDDPLTEMMKSLLDGHILLSRVMAERGHFPAIDPLKSVSRNSGALRAPRHKAISGRVLSLLSRFEGARALIESGLYTSGTDCEVDAAIAAKPRLDAYLAQDQVTNSDLQDSLRGLEAAVEGYDGRP
jgi:flagellum-specific ATP synthase